MINMDLKSKRAIGITIGLFLSACTFIFALAQAYGIWDDTRDLGQKVFESCKILASNPFTWFGAACFGLVAITFHSEIANFYRTYVRPGRFTPGELDLVLRMGRFDCRPADSLCVLESVELTNGSDKRMSLGFYLDIKADWSLGQAKTGEISWRRFDAYWNGDLKKAYSGTRRVSLEARTTIEGQLVVYLPAAVYWGWEKWDVQSRNVVLEIKEHADRVKIACAVSDGYPPSVPIPNVLDYSRTRN